MCNTIAQIALAAYVPLMIGAYAVYSYYIRGIRDVKKIQASAYEHMNAAMRMRMEIREIRDQWKFANIAAQAMATNKKDDTE